MKGNCFGWWRCNLQELNGEALVLQTIINMKNARARIRATNQDICSHYLATMVPLRLTRLHIPWLVIRISVDALSIINIMHNINAFLVSLHIFISTNKNIPFRKLYNSSMWKLRIKPQLKNNTVSCWGQHQLSDKQHFKNFSLKKSSP